SVREAPASCTAEQERDEPCRCCKINCWYTIAAAATHKLGHVPGQAGEEEALATLRLIRACMMSNCSEICPIRARPPFLSQE
uniref:4Fe-4S ferredoxin-type domain-containing protein n=1 Tax=Ascaris lumbricoides TaxID=6252 RepID=A0A0M3IE03_ASCLU